MCKNAIFVKVHLHVQYGDTCFIFITAVDLIRCQ